jgi:hypothetical protein
MVRPIHSLPFRAPFFLDLHTLWQAPTTHAPSSTKSTPLAPSTCFSRSPFSFLLLLPIITPPTFIVFFSDVSGWPGDDGEQRTARVADADNQCALLRPTAYPGAAWLVKLPPLPAAPFHVPTPSFFYSPLTMAGYIVHSGVRRQGGVQYLRFIIQVIYSCLGPDVQSDRHPAVLESRILAFVDTIQVAFSPLPLPLSSFSLLLLISTFHLSPLSVRHNRFKSLRAGASGDDQC